MSDLGVNVTTDSLLTKMWQGVYSVVQTAVQLVFAVSPADFANRVLPPPLNSTQFKYYDATAVQKNVGSVVLATPGGRGLRINNPSPLPSEPALGISLGAWLAAVFGCLAVFLILFEPDVGTKTQGGSCGSTGECGKIFSY